MAPTHAWGSLERSLPTLPTLALYHFKARDSPQTQLRASTRLWGLLGSVPGPGPAPHLWLQGAWGLDLRQSRTWGKGVPGLYLLLAFVGPLALLPSPFPPSHLHTGEDNKMHPTQRPPSQGPPRGQHQASGLEEGHKLSEK